MATVPIHLTSTTVTRPSGKMPRIELPRVMSSRRAMLSRLYKIIVNQHASEFPPRDVQLNAGRPDGRLRRTTKLRNAGQSERSEITRRTSSASYGRRQDQFRSMEHLRCPGHCRRRSLGASRGANPQALGPVPIAAFLLEPIARPVSLSVMPSERRCNHRSD